MTRRAHEPKQEVTLTGPTNKQAFPAKVTDDSAQEDNRNRVAAAKQADAEKLRAILTDEQREAADAKPVASTLPAGTKVHAPKGVVR